MGVGYLVCEGHGEQSGALGNLVHRLWADLGLRPLPFAPAIRGKALHTDGGIHRYSRLVAAKRDVAALLMLRDEDDACPKDLAPRQSARLVELALPFPVALVLARREYESIFLASLESLAGRPIQDPSGVRRPGLQAGAAFPGDLEGKRDVKGWLSAHWSGGRRYKPTLDQLPLTQMVDFSLVRRANLPWFGTLERALRFLASNQGQCNVYPPPML